MITPRSQQRIKEIQTAKVKRLLQLAFEESDFYRKLYSEHGFHPSKVKTLEDLHRVPIITRKMIQDAQAQDALALVPKSKRRSVSWKQTTSGSSGLPITICASRVERLKILAVILRGYRHNGVRYFDTNVTIKDPIDIAKPNIVQRLGGFRHEYYDIYQPVEEIYEQISRKWKSIAVLKSMPSDFANLGWFIKSQNLSFPEVRLLFTDSEKLDDLTRLFIENVFGTRAIDFYATTEVGVVAFQTAGSGGKYHVNDDAVLVETARNAQLDEQDEDLIVTGLVNFTTPIIRYQIGDVVTSGNREPVGKLPFTTLERIHGKYLDFLVRPDGKIVSSHAAKQNLTHLGGIRRFQVVQREAKTLTILIAPDNGWSDAVKDEIMRLFRRDFGPEMTIDIKIDHDLVHKSSDYKKFKVVESMVAQRLLNAD